MEKRIPPSMRTRHGASYRFWLKPAQSPWPDVARAEMTTELFGPDGGREGRCPHHRLPPPRAGAVRGASPERGFGEVRLLSPDGGEFGETPAEFVALVYA
jgi:hypothetical protein